MSYLILVSSCTADSVFRAAITLDGTGRLEEIVKLAFPPLEFAVAANVLLRDEDVRHAALARDLLEGVLQGGTVVYMNLLAGLCRLGDF